MNHRLPQVREPFRELLARELTTPPDVVETLRKSVSAALAGRPILRFPEDRQHDERHPGRPLQDLL